MSSEKKTGDEQFRFGCQSVTDVLSFWQWSSSNLLDNTMRGVIAEFIVARALGELEKPRLEWEPYDLETRDGLKIEVKSSAYCQNWEQKDLSIISFDIAPKTKPLADGKYSEEKRRWADVYVFCVLATKDRAKVDPLDLEQWDFYVLSTKVLNERIPEQKTIGLSSLLTLNPAKVRYDQLAAAINQHRAD